MTRCVFAAFCFTAVFPGNAFANAAVPLFRFSDEQTWSGIAIIIVIIALIEGALLRWRVKDVPFVMSFWRSLLINLASSAVGYVVVLALLDETQFGFGVLSLSLFLVTLVIEIPLLHWLYKQHPFSWKRASVLGLGINICSHAVILSAQAGILFGPSCVGPYLDARNIAKWNNPELLRQAQGVIYSCRPELSYFDFQNAAWVPVPGAPTMTSWDICGETCVYHCYDGPVGEFLIISRMPDFRVVYKVRPKDLIKHEYDTWREIRRIAVSPDEKKVALLFDIGDIVAPKDDEGFYDLGPQCLIVVLDTGTGQEIARISRWALDYDFCWMQDAQRILYYTLDDTNLLDPGNVAALRKGRRYSPGRGTKSVFNAGLYSFDILSRETSRFSNGYGPALASETGQILVHDGNRVILLGPSGNEIERLRVSNLGYFRSIISPEGDYVLARIVPCNPYRQHDFITLIDMHAPDTRHIIDDEGPYKGPDSYRSVYTWVAMK